MTERYFPWSQLTQIVLSHLYDSPITTSVKIQKIQQRLPTGKHIQKANFPQKHELQLRKTHFVVMNTAKNIIVDAFECQPSISVLIKAISQQKQGGEDQGQKKINNILTLIRFEDKNVENSGTTFYCSSKGSQILELYRTIPKTYTIQQDFHQLFKPIRKIGQGLTSTVYQALRLVDKTYVAVKAFKKSAYFAMASGKGQKAFLKEFKILSDCEHEAICSFKGVYQTENTIYIVQEYYEKSLSSLLFKEGEISRKRILSIIEDLLKGLAYLNSKEIMHRDIKPDNIMFRRTNNGYKPVIIDLGFAQYPNSEEYLFQRCGTPGYVAPEVFRGEAQSTKIDVFSLGVIFYNLLFKAQVFGGSNKEELINNNKSGILSLDMQKIEKEDGLLKDLLLKMLTVNVEHRISADEALAHPVFLEQKRLQALPTNTSIQEQADLSNQLNFSVKESNKL